MGLGDSFSFTRVSPVSYGTLILVKATWNRQLGK